MAFLALILSNWLGRQDSNLQPPGSKPGALPIVLRPIKLRSEKTELQDVSEVIPAGPPS